MESGKIPKKIYLMPAVIMIAAVIIAIVLRNPALSIIVLGAGAVLAFWAVRTGFKNGMAKGVEAAAEAKAATEAAQEEPLSKSSRPRQAWRMS